MSNENHLIPMLKDQCEVVQTTSVYNTFDIYLDEEIKDPTYYRQAFQVLRSAQEGDLVRIYISSYGGNLNSALIFKNCIEECRANVVAIIEAEAYSAASLIALSCGSIEVKPYATMMLHSASFSSGGSVSNVRDHVDFTGRHAESLMEEVYHHFITDPEMEDLKKGRELWFDYKQIGDRLENMFKMRAEEQQTCGDANCQECSDEFPEEISLDEIVTNAVDVGAQKVIDRLLKKFDLVPKAPKSARKKIEPKVQSVPERSVEEIETVAN